jgi:hypothetical protein
MLILAQVKDQRSSCPTDMQGFTTFLLMIYRQSLLIWPLSVMLLNVCCRSPRGYVPFETNNITSGVWKKSTNYALPTNPRHGTVFGITAKVILCPDPVSGAVAHLLFPT